MLQRGSRSTRRTKGGSRGKARSCCARSKTWFLRSPSALSSPAIPGRDPLSARCLQVWIVDCRGARVIACSICVAAGSNETMLIVSSLRCARTDHQPRSRPRQRFTGANGDLVVDELEPDLNAAILRVLDNPTPGLVDLRTALVGAAGPKRKRRRILDALHNPMGGRAGRPSSIAGASEERLGTRGAVVRPPQAPHVRRGVLGRREEPGEPVGGNRGARARSEPCKESVNPATGQARCRQ